MRPVGSYPSAQYGTITVLRGTYESADGPCAIVLASEGGSPLATLSVNMYAPECSRDSRDLPIDCFYVRGWGGVEHLHKEALASGLFIERPDLGSAESGFVQADVWQLTKAAGGFA